jgi:dTDP-glucose pyrophosphorylase
MKKHLKAVLIGPSRTVKEAMIRLDRSAEQILLVTDQDLTLLGTLTDGDIRRHILADGDLKERVSGVCNRQPTTVGARYSMPQVRQLMLDRRFKHLPVVDERRRVVDLLKWREVFGSDGEKPARPEGVPVVIMAGGRGTRLDPFTRILPKPLIPIDDKALVQVIMDRFLEQGCDRFIMTVNYKADMISSYFHSAEHRKRYKIQYVHEKERTGSAGSLALLTRTLRGDFFLSNCDVLVKADYSEILRIHRSQGNMLTIVASMQQFSVPYGVVELEPNGGLRQIVEKPEYDFLANTGLYLLNSAIERYFPHKGSFDMTELIARTRRKGGKVGVFPVSPGAWTDVGQWAEYFRNVMSSRGPLGPAKV